MLTIFSAQAYKENKFWISDEEIKRRSFPQDAAEGDACISSPHHRVPANSVMGTLRNVNWTYTLTLTHCIRQPLNVGLWNDKCI